jgi:hypothetical protein
MRYKIVRIEKVVYTGFINAPTIQDAYSEAMENPEDWEVESYTKFTSIKPEIHVLLPALGE